jgi:hypothetical protein
MENVMSLLGRPVPDEPFPLINSREEFGIKSFE